MTMVFKMSQNNIFTMKTVKENNVRRNITESFEFLSFFKEPREKKASLYPHQHLQALELMVDFQINLKLLACK